MRSAFAALGVLSAVAVSAATIPSATAAPPQTSAAPSRYQVAASPNWAGWKLSRSVQPRQASVDYRFTVPTVTCTPSNRPQQLAEWAGVDGDGTQDFARTGLLVTCQGSKPTFRLFYQLKPHAMVFVPTSVPLRPGATVRAGIGDAGPGMLWMQLLVYHAGNTYELPMAMNVPYHVAANSYECIVERPAVKSGSNPSYALLPSIAPATLHQPLTCLVENGNVDDDWTGLRPPSHGWNSTRLEMRDAADNVLISPSASPFARPHTPKSIDTYTISQSGRH